MEAENEYLAITRAVLWVCRVVEPEWRNVSRMERELRSEGWTRSEARRVINAAKRLEGELMQELID